MASINVWFVVDDLGSVNMACPLLDSRQGRSLSLVGCLVYLVLNVGGYFGVSLTIQYAMFGEEPLETEDGIALAPRGDFLSSAIHPVVVIGRMGDQSISLGFNQGWPVATAGALVGGLG